MIIAIITAVADGKFGLRPYFYQDDGDDTVAFVDKAVAAASDGDKSCGDDDSHEE